MNYEELQAEVVNAVTQADVCCPEQVCDMLFATALFGGDWAAELAKVKANDAIECKAIGVNTIEPASSGEISYL